MRLAKVLAKLWLPLVGLIGAIVIFSYNPAETSIYPPCLFHLMTGLYCPGCGSTRAIYQLLHGRILEALDLNALLVIFLGSGAFLAIIRALPLRTGRVSKIDSGIRLAWIWIIMGFTLLFWVARNLRYFPFKVLAP
jgi:hypothetical protein